MKMTMTMILALCAFAVHAAPAVAGAGAREQFMKDQAYMEVQRVMGQVDVLESNQEKLSQRLSRLESKGDSAAMRGEIDALRSDLNSLRSEMRSMRNDIVDDIVRRIEKKLPKQTAAAPATSGPRTTYKVRPGDTLSLIAQAFGTTVSKLREMNHLSQNAVLRVGQELAVPDPAGKGR